MNIYDFLALLPLVILAIAPTALLLLIAALRYPGLRARVAGAQKSGAAHVAETDISWTRYRNHIIAAVYTFIALLAALCAILVSLLYAPRTVTPLFTVDAWGSFFAFLVIGSAVGITGLSYGYLKDKTEPLEEFYALLMSATLGSVVMVMSRHTVSLFLGLGILNISLYAMIAYLRRNPRGLEAAFKYVILAATSDAFLLFGIAVMYGRSGALDFAGITGSLSNPPLMTLAGLAMLLAGFAFKLALPPFHMWIADVYEGAPAPVTAFIAATAKAATIGVMFRFFAGLDIAACHGLIPAMGVAAALAMCAGNFLALLQTNLKRMLAYSAIAHMGYLLVVFPVTEESGRMAAAFYITAYLITALGAFGVITQLSGPDQEAEDLEDYRGLAWRRPWAAPTLAAMMFSLAGIPLTAGFMGKFYVMSSGIQASMRTLIICLVINSIIGLFYYLRVILVMYSPLPAISGRPTSTHPSIAGGIVLAALTACLLGMGVYPEPFIRLVKFAVAAL